MNEGDSTLDGLIKYFEETPHEKIMEDWEKTAYLDELGGPTVGEFIDRMNRMNIIDNDIDNECINNTETEYMKDLIGELIDMYENPLDSNDEWKSAIVRMAREKGYGFK